MGDHILPARKIQVLDVLTLAEDDHDEQIENAPPSTAASSATLHADRDPLSQIVGAEKSSPGSSKYQALNPPQQDITRREAQITYAHDASFTELNFPNRKQSRTGARHGGGIRGKIKTFSSSARRKMRHFTAQISRESRALHVLLTYPEDYPQDPTLLKTHLERFLKRLDRRYGKHAILWRLEFQQRGAPHYHLVVFFNAFLPVSNTALREFRTFVASSWYEACGKLSEEHLEAGTSVERVRSLVGLMKYLAKPESLQRGLRRGLPGGSEDPEGEGLCSVRRRWGAWNRGLLPISLEKVWVNIRDAYYIRRILRKLSHLKPRGTVRTLRLFIRDVVLKRLLAFLGYPPP